MLDTTYRMNLEINQFSSKQFYGGRLKCDAICAHRTLVQKGVAAPQIHEDILDPEEPDVLVCHSYRHYYPFRV
ncbi:MAG: hypothetical protein IPJ00_19325 [Saprospirales bacterium]|nr:hypothetical protein [Saprospirales bacterium]